MGRPGITYSHVADAALQIAAKGNNPTIESIRAILKSGSSGTIAQHLRTWKAKQDATSHIATKEKLPEEFIAVMTGLWEKLVCQADDQVNAIQQATEQTIAQLQQAVEKLQQENHQWQQQFHAMKQEKEGLSQDKETLEQILSHNQTESAAFQAKYDGLAQHLQEKQARIDELNRLNQQIQANLEHYRETAREQRLLEQQRVEQQQRQLEHAIHQLQQEVKARQQENQLLQQQAAQSHFQLEAIQSELSKLSLLYEASQSRVLLLDKELTKEMQTQAHWRMHYEAEKTKCAEQNKELIELQKQQSSLTQKLVAAELALKDIIAQNKLLSHEKWELGQEKAKLSGQLKQLENVM